MLVYHAMIFPGRSFKKSIFWSDIMDSISRVALSLRCLTRLASKAYSSDLYRAERTLSPGLFFVPGNKGLEHLWDVKSNGQQPLSTR